MNRIAKLLGLAYFKAAPTEYVYHMRNNRILHEGKGQGFWCNTRKDNVLLVPLSEWDDPFTTVHRCEDDQDVRIDGKVLYQITKPSKFIENFNYSVDAATRQRCTTDSQRLVRRIIDLVSDSLRTRVRDISLEDLLNEKTSLGKAVKGDITARINLWGVKCNGIYVSKIVPTSPELIDALEAPYREKRLLEGEREKLNRQESIAQEEHKNQMAELARQKESYGAQLENIQTQRDNRIEEAKTAAEARKIELAVLSEAPVEVLFTEALKRVNYVALTPDTLAELRKYRGYK